jgi:hypothetical protein
MGEQVESEQKSKHRRSGFLDAGAFRRNLLLSGLAGLLSSGLLTVVAVWLITANIIQILLPYPAVALLLALVFGGFSVAEIPMMIFVMRRLIVERRGNDRIVLGLNALFVFFAAVYGAPVLLLTGSLGWGLALCGLAIIRLLGSLLFVHEVS